MDRRLTRRQDRSAPSRRRHHPGCRALPGVHTPKAVIPARLDLLVVAVSGSDKPGAPKRRRTGALATCAHREQPLSDGWEMPLPERHKLHACASRPDSATPVTDVAARVGLHGDDVCGTSAAVDERGHIVGIGGDQEASSTANGGFGNDRVDSRSWRSLAQRCGRPSSGQGQFLD